ncbi:MAG: exodeoxyribonuclease VII small subunit [Pseudomonadota bacterium]
MTPRYRGRMPAKEPTDAPAAPATEPAADLPFEDALAQLDDVVAQMESGDLPLEAALSAYERGIRLSRHCQQALKTAELKVKQLSADGTLSDINLSTEDAPSSDH